MPKARKIIITGPGRSGTTLLIRLLTELHLDTGYESDSISVDPVSNAGLEQPNWHTAQSPYIVKSPLISESLHYALATGEVAIDHAFIPMRPLREVVASRARVDEIGGQGRPGGLDEGLDFNGQRDMHARQFYRLMMALTQYDIPHTLLEFPRLARDPAYLYKGLQALLSEVSFEDFNSAFSSVVNEALIHTYK